MSKKWLEEIRKLLVNLYNAADVDEEMKHYIFNDLKIEWLVEQAERVQELEKERDEWKYTAQSYYMTNQELREQNKRYREALISIITLWIASTDATDDTWLAYEMSVVARKALEGLVYESKEIV